jgi:hypothetical protein
MRKGHSDLVPVLRRVARVLEELARMSAQPSDGRDCVAGPSVVRALEIGRTWETGAALRERRINTALIEEVLRLIDAVEHEDPAVLSDVLYPLWHKRAVQELTEAARLASAAGLHLVLPETLA